MQQKQTISKFLSFVLRHNQQIVGPRPGKPVILTITSGSMHRDSKLFYLSANRCDHVPPEYIEF